MDEKKILTPSEAPKFDTGTQTTPVAFGALPFFRLAATLLPSLRLLWASPPASPRRMTCDKKAHHSAP